MNDTLYTLKTDSEKLPFPIPGQTSYQDFAEKRFEDPSSVFIRPVLLLRTALPPQPKGFQFPGMEHCCMLLYIKEGHGRVENGDESFDLPAGSGLFATADGMLHLKSTRRPLSFVLLYLTGDLLWELHQVQKKPTLCFTGYQYPDFEQRLDSLLGEYLNADSPLLFDFSRHMDHLLSRIIHQSMRKNDKSKQKKQALMRALTYMKEHCCEQLQVEEIAAAFGYSSSHFSRIFQAELHQSPKKYLIGLRLAQAEKLLATSDLSVEAIGQECGFNNTAHFIQTFRSAHAMTPLQYRKIHA